MGLLDIRPTGKSDAHVSHEVQIVVMFPFGSGIAIRLVMRGTFVTKDSCPRKTKTGLGATYRRG